MKQLILFSLIIAVTIARHTKEEWRNRTIYQILTDRFSPSEGVKNDCPNLRKYCGGTFRGIMEHLDYIQGMGFDAIWISPVIENTKGGYHGYWGKDWSKLNSHFGTPADFKKLVEECHKRGIWVMVDVVANHVGPIGFDYSNIFPFNTPDYYHKYCEIRKEDWKTNQWRVENCRLADLPDLSHENPLVESLLLKYIGGLVTDYNIDGLRVDTVPEVPKTFWKKFNTFINTFTLGEVFDERFDYCKGYIGYLDSVLNYLIYFQIKKTFKGDSFNELVATIEELNNSFGSSLNEMGVFVDNHDNTRFLFEYGNYDSFVSALLFSLFYNGIPIVYYGDEQEFKGGEDPENREILWKNMDTNSRLYKVLSSAISIRKKYKVWESPYIHLTNTDSMLAFSRGQVLIVLSNSINVIDMYIAKVPFKNGSRICDVINGGCALVVNGKAYIKLGPNKSGIFVEQ